MRLLPLVAALVIAGCATVPEIDASKLPHPEVCRAILVTGRFEPLRRRGQQALQDQRTQRQKGSGKGKGQGQSTNDPDKLLAMLGDNDGWVAELYLA